MKENEFKWTTCPRDDCRHGWMRKGTAKRVTCPRCRQKFNDDEKKKKWGLW